MSTQLESRVEVGECKMGHVFIYHRASKGDYTDKPERDTWTVRAGNHTVGVYDTEAGANDVARALCGEQRLTNEFIAENSVGTSSEMDAYVSSTRKRVIK